MPEKLERCVRDVKAKSRGKGVNPYAICVASTGLKFKKHGTKKRNRK
jgi:hypothetical protein